MTDKEKMAKEVLKQIKQMMWRTIQDKVRPEPYLTDRYNALQTALSLFDEVDRLREENEKLWQQTESQGENLYKTLKERDDLQAELKKEKELSELTLSHLNDLQAKLSEVEKGKIPKMGREELIKILFDTHEKYYGRRCGADNEGAFLITIVDAILGKDNV